MESKDAAARLNEVERLSAVTAREARAAPRGAVTALIAAVAIFWGATALLGDQLAWGVAVLYAAFVIGWAAWIRRSRRAAAKRVPTRRILQTFIAGALVAVTAGVFASTFDGNPALIGLTYGVAGAGLGWWISRRLRPTA